MVEYFERNTIDFLEEEYASDNPFGQEASIGNVDDDDTHVPTPVEFQAMIDDLQGLNALVGQHFDERMTTQAEVESKQLKILIEKTEAMYEYAQVVIYAIDEQARTTSERAKAIAAEREEQSQSQGTILKAIPKIVRQQRLEVAS